MAWWDVKFETRCCCAVASLQLTLQHRQYRFQNGLEIGKTSALLCENFNACKECLRKFCLNSQCAVQENYT